MFRSQMEILLKIMIFPFSSIECYNHDYIADLANSKNYSEYRNTYKKEFKNILFGSLKNKYSIHNLDYIDMIIEKYYSHSFIRGKSSNNIANEISSLYNNLISIESYNSSNYDYLRNEAIINGIRNSISHGGVKIINTGNMYNTILEFVDEYNGEIEFKLKISLFNLLSLTEPENTKITNQHLKKKRKSNDM